MYLGRKAKGCFCSKNCKKQIKEGTSCSITGRRHCHKSQPMAKSSVLTYSDSYETIKGCKKWLPIQNYEDNRRGKN